MVMREIIMVKKHTLLLITHAFLVTAPCLGMQMAAQQSSQSIRTLDESAAKELIQHFLGKKYNDMAAEVRKLSEENKEFIKDILNKSHLFFMPEVRVQQGLYGHTDWIISVAFSPNGRFALTGSRDDTARLWDLTTNPITSQELKGHENCVNSVAFSPDGRFALSASLDKTARLWNLTQSPITSQELTHHTKALNSVACSPDSRFALTGSNDNTAHLWDLTQSPIIGQELTGHKDWIRSVAFSPNGRLALTGSEDETARLWDLTRLPFISQKLTGHINAVSSVAFSPDSCFALTGSFDNTARLWDLTKSPITFQELKGHSDAITSVAFSPDGRSALTGSFDETARLWDLTKSPITSQEIKGHKDMINSIAFSPDGKFALTGSDDMTAILWKIEQSNTKVLSVDDSLLLLKLIENEDCLKDDCEALNRLELIMKDHKQQNKIRKLITDYFYRTILPAQACCICTEKYDTDDHICMQLPCCKQCICKVCLDRIGKMTYSTQFESYQFEDHVQKKCPYCNRPANQIGTIKKYDANKNGGYRCVISQ